MQPTNISTQHQVRKATAASGLCCFVMLVALLPLQPALPAPAEAVISYPAGAQQAPQPAGIFVDSQGEIYVADAVGSRIIIYDPRGNYEFEFSTRDRLSGPRQVAVDSRGRIFVLGEGKPRGLVVFDFDGEYLRDLDLAFPTEDTDLEPGSFVIHEDHILFLRPAPARVCEFDLDGKPLREFAVLQEMDSETRNAPILGSLAVVNHLIVIPLPMMAQVARYTLDGTFHDLFGMAGGAPGSLSFPVAVADDRQGGIIVLDKHRHALLHYTADGKFTHEVSGYGQSEGWFYYPAALATAQDGRCIVGQSFSSRMQWVSLLENVDASPVIPAVR